MVRGDCSVEEIVLLFLSSLSKFLFSVMSIISSFVTVILALLR